MRVQVMSSRNQHERSSNTTQVVAQLVAMGFGENGCRRAAVAAENNVDMVS